MIVNEFRRTESEDVYVDHVDYNICDLWADSLMFSILQVSIRNRILQCSIEFGVTDFGMTDTPRAR